MRDKSVCFPKSGHICIYQNHYQLLFQYFCLHQITYKKQKWNIHLVLKLSQRQWTSKEKQQRFINAICKCHVNYKMEDLNTLMCKHQLSTYQVHMPTVIVEGYYTSHKLYRKQTPMQNSYAMCYHMSCFGVYTKHIHMHYVCINSLYIMCMLYNIAMHI